MLIRQPASEPTPVQESSPVREPTESAPETAPVREPTPEPAPVREPTELAPVREPTEPFPPKLLALLAPPKLLFLLVPLKLLALPALPKLKLLALPAPASSSSLPCRHHPGTLVYLCLQARFRYTAWPAIPPTESPPFHLPPERLCFLVERLYALLRRGGNAIVSCCWLSTWGHSFGLCLCFNWTTFPMVPITLLPLSPA